MCCLHYPRVMTLSSRWELATTWDHYRYASDGDYGTTQGALPHDFGVSIFFMCDFFFTHDFWSCTSVLMFFRLHILFCRCVFGCPKRATTRSSHLQSLTAMLTRSWKMQFPMFAFRRTISMYDKEVLHQKISKKLSSSTIYLTEEQYHQVKNPKSFDIQHLILIVIWCTSSIFVQAWIPLFRNREHDYFEFCKLWSSRAFRALSEKKRLYHGKDPKHKYDADGHIHKSKRMVRVGVVLSAIYIYIYIYIL
jgi:hypothetical protein